MADQPAVEPAAGPSQDPVSLVQDKSSLGYAERYKFARDELPEFSAKPDLTSEQYTSKCKTTFKAWSIAEADAIHLSLSKLKGNAANFQVELQDTQTTIATFEELAQRLRSRFPVPPEEGAAYQLQHKSRMQGNDLAKYISPHQPAYRQVGVR